MVLQIYRIAVIQINYFSKLNKKVMTEKYNFTFLLQNDSGFLFRGRTLIIITLDLDFFIRKAN